MTLPEKLNIHKRSSELELVYPNNYSVRLSAEYLRVFSPSAEVQGHAQGKDILQYGKRNVQFLDIEPQGNYAIKINFSDGHDTGIYSWDYLYELATEYEKNWANYLERLSREKKSRTPLFIDAVTD
ncbi:MAG: 1-(5-phosphoribosyl)-5-((5-phosphoribosylamino)methylideneamino)imidazole-4-carboxamide isomerase [Gammaproteobacteria bacterium]|nr:1-(5-phosphoribosyl)-5-((5-phosphoribosylamino)methylideneamino)imidazole-4-carboxamide isomerase [Gammaproteobacteria bacterium]|tara:strand:+ start:943 stop:1320 length:378 start_codon:yes stop_codon:yes gene_type:complete